MNVQINYTKKISKKNSVNKVFFVNESFQISALKNYMATKEFSCISDLLKSKDLKKKILSFDINSKLRIVLVSLKTNIKSSKIERLGAKFYDIFKSSNIKDFNINSDTVPKTDKNVVGYFLHGLKLKSYNFDKYKSKKNKENLIFSVTGKHKPLLKDQIRFKAIEEGTFFTRDLVSEPGNVLHPDEYAKRLNLLKKDGLKITIYDEKKIKKIRDEYSTWCRSRKYQGFIFGYYGMERIKRQF